MFVEILIAILIGTTCGIFTGLCPGIHVNMVSAILLGISPLLLKYVSALSLCCFIISMSITHTFLDNLPSIFLGAPDESTALGVLPGHRYLLRGDGMMAVRLSTFGSLGGLILSIIFFPLLIPVVKYAYPVLENYIGYLLIVVVVFMIMRDNKKLWGLFIFCLSGALGIIVLNIPDFADPLFPMFSGMFGISTLLVSLNDSENIPKQKVSDSLKIEPKITIKALLSGEFSGFLTAFFPGLGSSTAAVISLQITRKLGDYGFMILLGSINTVNCVLSLVTLLVLDKARNGYIVAVQKLIEVDLRVIIIFLCVCLFAGSVSFILTIKIGKIFSSIITKVNYKILVVGIIFLVFFLVLLLTGPLGVLVLIVSTAIGLIPAIIKTARTHSMGCLLLPVILYFIL